MSTKTTTSVLLVTGDESLKTNVAEIISQVGRLHLEVVSDVSAAASTVNTARIDVVVLHLTDHADDNSAAKLIHEMALRRPGCATLVISDDYRPEQKARLLKEGVADYLVRPINLRRLAYLIDVLTIEARHFATSQVAEAACDSIKSLSHGEPFLYGPGEMEQIVAQVKTVAPLDTTILLCGETGTGKTRMAKLIHELSPRRSNPFVWADCGAISWPLVESELFGHAKGSFTGADSSSPGKFARASDGTLMIDDIDNIPLELQSKFLRAVDERVYEPVGGTRQLPLTARLIVTTNKSLKQEVDEGRFRSDLYYRINVISFRLPPLRERREMIPVLATSFAKDVARRQNRTPPVFSKQAVQDLQSYDWPGNVRELRNTVERCVTLSTKSLIEADVFPEELRQQSVKLPLSQPQYRDKESSNWRQAKRDAEALALQNALNQSGNNRSVAARKLGISRVTLYKKLHEYDLF